MQIRLTYPSDSLNPHTIGRALEAATSVAETQLDKVPNIYDLIDSGAVVWRPEPRGQRFESFDTPLQVVARGWGDCDDLAPFLCAHLRQSGEDEGATPIAYPSGPNKWHCVVQRSDNSIDDPSRWAGMGRKEAYDVPVDRPIMGHAGKGGMVIGESSPGCYVCRFDLACSPSDDAGLSVRRSGSTPVEAVENAAKSGFHIALHANMDRRLIKQLWGVVAALRGYGMDYIRRHTGLEPHEQGSLAPLIVRAYDVADEYDVDGDGILSTIFDPFGIHHVFDPLLQPAMDQAKNVTIAPKGGGPGVNLQSLLSTIIGQWARGVPASFNVRDPSGSASKARTAAAHAKAQAAKASRTSRAAQQRLATTRRAAEARAAMQPPDDGSDYPDDGSDYPDDGDGYGYGDSDSDGGIYDTSDGC